MKAASLVLVAAVTLASTPVGVEAAEASTSDAGPEGTARVFQRVDRRPVGGMVAGLGSRVPLRPDAARALDAMPDFALDPYRPRAGEPVEFVGISSSVPTAWDWDFGDGNVANGARVTNTYAQPGVYDVALTITDAAGTRTTTKSVVVWAQGTGTGDVFTYLLPVVLTASGVGGSRFSTEVTLTNGTNTDLGLVFTAKGTAGGVGFEEQATYTLPPGQVVQPDAWAFLTSLGMAVPAGDPLASLRIGVSGLTDLTRFGAQARVTTPPSAELAAAGVQGRFGLAFAATPLTYAAEKRAVIYGLQQTAGAGGARSNVACVNAGAADGPVTLEVAYVDGATGLEHPSRDRFEGLGPFEWRQLSRPLEPRGIASGYAVVSRTAGAAQFLCYGVVNDNVNSDGSFVPMVGDDADLLVDRGFVPVVLEVAGYRSEASFANRSSNPTRFFLTFVPSARPEEPVFAALSLAAGRQLVVDDFVGQLRRDGFDVPEGAVGPLFAQLEDEATQEPLPFNLGGVSVRTYTEKAGARFGLAYGATPLGQAAEETAVVRGLQQSGTRGVVEGTRSNLAVVNVGGGGEAEIEVEVAYDGPDGTELGKEAECNPCTLAPGEWRQFNAPLEGRNGFVAPNATARVHRISGTDQVLAYGVLNDQLNDDGSFVPMQVP